MKRPKRNLRGFILLMILLSTMAIGFFVNRSEAATEYKYMIKVNKQMNTVTIYEKDEKGKYTVPVKAMVCSTGWATPLGTYKTPVKYRWKILLEDVWGQYSTRITGSILFHSVWYYKKDPSTLSAAQYNKLGTTCSHGCIRLTVEDAKWIYDNCPIGTTVTIYNSKDPGPLGKPKALKLKAGTGWDPTDPNPKNPLYKDYQKLLKQQEEEEKAAAKKKEEEAKKKAEEAAKKKEQEKLVPKKIPTIHGLKSKKIEWGSTFDPLAGITAKDELGADLTSKIKVSGSVDTKKTGLYHLTYSVKDCVGHERVAKIKIQVLDCPYTVTFKGVKNRVISVSQVVDEAYCLEGVRAYFGSKKLKTSVIEVTIDKQEDGYCITYEAEGENGDTSQSVAVFTIDNEAPVIQAEHMLYDVKEDINRDFVLNNIFVADDHTNITPDMIDVQIEELYRWGHLITITVQDACGNVATKKVQYTKECSTVIYGVKNRTVPKGTKVDRDFVMLGITGYDDEVEKTEEIKVTIDEPVNGEYRVTYQLDNDYGSFAKIVAFFTVEK